MSAESEQAKSIFGKAIDIESADERAAYLEQACREQPQLRAEVDGLLSAHAAAGGFLASPAGGSTIGIITERPGTVIGPYKLLQRIGEGGMGVVYMVEQTEPIVRHVALKIIKPGMDTRQVIARFESERQALALMDHPNIAKVYDAGATDTGRPYFVMELIHGDPITKYCDDHQLTTEQRLELFRSVCQAVQHAHQKGVIHRDIKPTNVLVAEYDDRPVVKVIDFGVAKAIGQHLTEKTLFTEFGQIIGTPEYMSPEQAKRNQLDIDTRSDIYSLGVLLYELLTGQTPFDRQRLRSAAHDELLRIIREENPPRPSVRLSTCQALPTIAAHRHTEPKKLSTLVRGELDWIVMKALEKERTRRYDTAKDLAEDVRRHLTDESVEARPPSTLYRLKKVIRRYKAAAATVTVVAATLILATILLTWLWTEEQRSRRKWEMAQRETQALREDSEHLRRKSNEMLYEAIRAQVQSGDYPAAVEAGRFLFDTYCIDHGLQDDRTSKAAIQLAGALTGLRRTDEAFALLEKVLEAQTDRLGRESVFTHRTARALAELYRRTAWNLAFPAVARLEDYDLAVELAQRCIELDVGRNYEWTTLALAHYRRGDFDKALNCLKYGVERDREYPERAWWLLAMVHWKIGDKELGQACYLVANYRDTDDGAFRRIRMEATNLLKTHESWTPAEWTASTVIDACNHLLPTYPHATYLYLRRSSCQANLGNWREAARDQARAIELAPHSHLGRYEGWVAYLLADKAHDDANAAVRRVFDKFRTTENTSDQLRLARLCSIIPSTQIDFQELEHIVADAERRGAAKSAVALSRRIIAYRSGKWEVAVDPADEVVLPPELTPDRVLTIDNHVLLGDWQQQVLSLAFRAMANHQLGRKEQAVQLLSETRKLAPSELPSTVSVFPPVSRYPTAVWCLARAAVAEAEALLGAGEEDAGSN